MPPSPQSHATINQLSEETGADRRSIKKWLAADDIQPGASGYSRREAVACIGRHRGADADDGKKDKSAFAEKTAEEVIKLRRENRIAAKLEDETYMLTDDVEKMMLMGISKIENIPSKIESEFGLPQHQIKRLTALLDEVRTEWAKGLKGMGK